MYACALVLLAACRFVFDRKVQTFCWPNSTSLEFAGSIYVKTMEATCVSEELEEVEQIMSLGDSRIMRVRDRISIDNKYTLRVFNIYGISMPTVREWSWSIASYIKRFRTLFLFCEFGGFENVLRYPGIRAIPT